MKEQVLNFYLAGKVSTNLAAREALLMSGNPEKAELADLIFMAIEKNFPVGAYAVVKKGGKIEVISYIQSPPQPSYLSH